MQFNDTTNLTGLIQQCERNTGLGNASISGNTTLLKQFTARLNEAMDRFAYLALTSSGDWEFDDTNYTDFPIGVDDIVSGQQDYAFASDVLIVNKVLVKDSAGEWKELSQVDLKENESANIWKLTSGNSGIPTQYEIFANSILLDPIPNYNSSNGLKVVFQRNVSKFANTDTTKEPGIPSIFHTYLGRYASMLFLLEPGKASPTKNDLASLITSDESSIVNFYNRRNPSKKIVIKPQYSSSR